MPSRFSMSITATAADIDELGHVGNLVYLKWVLDVAMEHSRAIGWDVPQYRALGLIFIVRRHEIDYVAPVTSGQILTAETWVEDWHAAWCIRRTELARDGQIVARAATKWAMISLESGRPTRIHPELRTKFT